ncbi:MAG: hypothetical protein EOM61_04940 [Bacteroidia bacterium]|nr:hypothetical protein [Bacteroidia bacterium]
METKMQNFNITEMFGHLMEMSLFLSPSVNRRRIAKLCGCSPGLLDQSLKEEFGFTSMEIVALYRLQFARNLMALGAGYKDLYRYSGFSSRTEMERALKYIVN